MNKKDLLDRFSDVDPKLIADAHKKPRKRHGVLIGTISGAATVAAAAAIAVFAGTRAPTEPVISISYSSTVIPVDSSTDSKSDTSAGTSGDTDSTSTMTTPPIESDPFAGYDDLPVISPNDYGQRGAGGGLIGIGLSKRTRSLKSYVLEEHSPWNENADIKTLPVYISSSTEPDFEVMREYLRNAAAALEIDEGELEITDNSADSDGQYESYRKMLEDQNVPEDEIERELERIRRISESMAMVYGAVNDIRLDLNTAYILNVRFDEPITLPEGCMLGDNDDESVAAVNYLADKFKELLCYECPIVEPDNNDGAFYRVYEGAGDIETQIVNYSLKYTVFFGDYEDSSKMDLIRCYSTENCQKLGDYPILTAQQAKEILSSDSTPEKYRLPADAKIVKTDIVYSNLPGFTVVMPYYEFHVETDATPDPCFDAVCDIYRIPAVPERFISAEAADYGVRA